MGTSVSVGDIFEMLHKTRLIVHSVLNPGPVCQDGESGPWFLGLGTCNTKVPRQAAQEVSS